MNFEFTEEQEAARELAGHIFADATSFDRLREIEADEKGPGYDTELWSQIAESNLIGLPIAEEFGGQGFGFFSLCLMLEEAGRQLAPVPLLESVVYAALPIQEFGSDILKKELLPRVVSGQSVLSAALFEVGDPALSRRPRTRASAGADGFRIDGEKVCVPYAAGVEKILVPASGEGGLGLFLVSPKAAGVHLEQQDTTAHERQYVMRLEGVTVSGDDVVAVPGSGEAIFDWLEPRASVALAAIAVGAADEALRQTAEYTSTRKQFGREIGSFQGVSLRAADAYIDVQAMRSTMWQAAWRIENGKADPKSAAVAKWWACMGGHRVSHTAQHLHGGIGADIDYPIHRFYLRLKHLAMTLGGASEQLATLGARMADEARSGGPVEQILA
ncbi:MAG: acyl-CoA dehydrogenase family protein [Deltaproteobacteria bacterium]|jgi:alkylation response protein AidB-like acyl-CoA dehydrogenase|nr:acyl-CoA dehydrogenase family protein [Deltaproteobacteria bacterium]